jgi:hypothetical protein
MSVARIRKTLALTSALSRGEREDRSHPFEMECGTDPNRSRQPVDARMLSPLLGERVRVRADVLSLSLALRA